MYNLTATQNATDLLEFIVAVNDLGSGTFMASFMLVLFVINFIMFKRDDNLTALLYASYMTSVVSIFFMLVGFMDIMIMIIPIILTAIFTFLKMTSRD